MSTTKSPAFTGLAPSAVELSLVNEAGDAPPTPATVGARKMAAAEAAGAPPAGTAATDDPVGAACAAKAYAPPLPPARKMSFMTAFMAKAKPADASNPAWNLPVFPINATLTFDDGLPDAGDLAVLLQLRLVDRYARLRARLDPGP